LFSKPPPSTQTIAIIILLILYQKRLLPAVLVSLSYACADENR
jgi:hypothetical protein